MLERRGFITGDCEDKRILMHDNIYTKKWNTRYWFIGQKKGVFGSDVPALPGCYSQGETIEETMENVKEAIEAHLLALKEEREEVPTEEEFVIGRVKVGVSAVV